MAPCLTQSWKNSTHIGSSLSNLLHVHTHAMVTRGRRPFRVVSAADGGSKELRPVRPKGTLRVPSSKELQKMRQFRQQQLFRQQQQMRHVQRLAPAPTPGVEVGTHEQARKQSRSASPKKSSSSKQSRQGNKKNAVQVQKVEDGMTEEEFAEFASKYGLEVTWRPQTAVLRELGLSPSNMTRIADSRPEIFQISLKTMTRKIEFFRETVGMSDADIVKIVCKSPRVLEYGSEQTVRPRLNFLQECGVSSQNRPKVVLKAPMIMSLGLKETLEPRAEFLKKSLGLNKSNLGKLISRHPQVLTCTQDMMQQRVDFLTQKAGIKQEDLGKVVVAHPQVLHYKLDSMMERLNYLNFVGMNAGQISQAVSRFPQVFSLSVTTNMAPKWHYLVEHLGGDVNALCSYPGYFSLSLQNRIMMRHLYLEHAHGSAPLPFPLGHLKMSDDKFASEVAGTTLAEYEAFKNDKMREQDSSYKSDSDSETPKTVVVKGKERTKLSNVLRIPPKSTLNLV